MAAIRPVQTGEVSTIAPLLEVAELPTASLEETELFVLEEDGAVAGTVGIEMHSPYALLRSLAVKPSAQGKGYGRTLLMFAEDEARRHDMKAAFALTTSIPDLLTRYGFKPIERDELPTELSASAELRGACPSSAFAFRKDLS